MTADTAKTTTQSTAKAKTKSTTPPKQSQGADASFWLAIVAIVIAIVACAAAAYLFYQGQQLKASSIDLHNQTQAMQTQLQQTQVQANAFAQTVSAAQSKQNQQIKEAMLQLHQDKTKATQTIALGSAIYLVRLANLAIMIDHDPKLAAHLLQMAQAHLQPVPAMDDLRNAVIHYREALLAVPSLDLDGLLMQLAGLKQVVMQLPSSPKPALTTPTDTAQAQQAHITANWQTLWAYLKQFFVITHHDDDHASLPSITHMQAVKDSVFLSLSTAQWALLHQQSDVYQHALHGAIVQLATVAQTDPQAVKSMITTIDSLYHVTIQPSYPPLGQLVEQLMKAQITLAQGDATGVSSDQAAKVDQASKTTSSPAQKPETSKPTIVTKQKVMQGVEA